MNPYHRIRDFHGVRRRAVGSSDIPTLAGLTKRWGSTPYRLWEEKTGRREPWRGNDATWWGHIHEDTVLHRFVRDRFDLETARRFLVAKIRDRSTRPLMVQTECTHPDYRFALAHADLLVEDQPLIVEAKSHGLYAASRTEDPDFGYDPEDRGQNGVPASVFLQVQWQLLCYGVDSAEIAVLINTNDYRTYGPIAPDRKIQEQELALAERFMWHVENDRPPKPETWDDICALFPKPTQTTAMVAGEQEEFARRAVEKKSRLLKAEKRIKSELAEIRNALGLLIGENSVLTTAEGDVLARSYARGRETVDIAGLRKDETLYGLVARAGLIKSSSWRELR